MPVSEDTINDLVADYLRGEFAIDITTQPTGQIPAGRRKPDFELHWNGKTYFGEGEWLSSYGRGLQQALDFGEIPGASGWFLLGYPDEIKREVTQRRLGSADPATLLKGLTFRQCLLKGPGTPADLRQVRVEDLHAWIGSVLAARPPAPEPTEFIRLMHYVVGNLATFLPKTKGTARLFEHVVAMIPSKKDEEDAARTGAAYLLLNQLVFYRLLAGHTELGWPQMEARSVKSPLDVKAHFDRVMQQDYHAIFKTNVIDLFPQRAFPFIQSLIKLVSELQPEAFTRTLLGTIFHQLIPEPVRKPVAAFYTQPPAARLLVGLAGVHGADRVSDFACGSGTLLVAAYEAKSQTDSRPNSQSRHATYLEKELTGIDIMPFAAHLAVVQLALMNPTQWTNRVQVAVDNSLEKRVGDVVRSLERHAVSPQTRLSHFAEEPEERARTVRGAVSTNGAGAQFQLAPPQVVLMNPPFSRKQFISKEYRKELATSFTDEAKFHRNDMGYWGYFVLLADRFLPDGGKLALVISAALLREGSSASIREMLRSKYRLDYIVMSASRTAFSEDASFPDFLLVATKTADRSRPCRLAMLHAPLELERVDWLRTRIESGEGAPEVAVATLAQDRFSADDWLPLIPGAVPEESSILLPKTAPVCKLGAVSGLGLIQGIRMESGSEFANPADMLISSGRSYESRAAWKARKEDARVVVAYNPEGAREVTIPRHALLPALRTISGSRRLEVKGRPPDYVVAERFPHDTEFWVTNNPEGMLVRRRKHLRSRVGNIVFGGYGNLNLSAEGTSLLAVASKSGIAPTWNCWSVKTPDWDTTRILTLWWNSTFNLLYLLHHRMEVEGATMKWRKPSLEAAPVLDIRKLDARTKARLLALFDRLTVVDFPSITEQYSKAPPERTELDSEVGRALGIANEELPSRLNDLYRLVSDELTTLRSRMRATSLAKSHGHARRPSRIEDHVDGEPVD